MKKANIREIERKESRREREKRREKERELEELDRQIKEAKTF